MGRRGENIRKRVDGRWEARIVQGSPVKGKTNYKYLYARSYQEVRNRKLEFLQNISSQKSEANFRKERSETKLREVTGDWLNRKKPLVKESTFACYAVMVETHILPELGELDISELTSERMAAFLMDRKQHGRKRNGGSLSNKTVSDLKAILKQILSFAESCGLIDSVPDCPSVCVRQPPISVLTRQEQSKLEALLMQEDRPFSLGILLSLYGGLRIGEVCALRWKDFDFQNGTVQVSHTLFRISDINKKAGSKTKVVISKPKTDSSLREIPLPTPIFHYLKERRQNSEVYLLTGTKKYMEPRVCRERFGRLLQRAGVARHTWHALRHTFATRCVENGVDLKSLSEIMGHSNIRITLQRYVHPSMDSKKEQVNKLPCAFANGQNRGQGNRESA
ncbi:MAG: site-specific integrase [Lachnospiraceae bacterium]|nr:site-specific integrase [Lachnospiraceae bacterium]